MISGSTSEPSNLSGTITAQKTLTGSLNVESTLVGKVSVSVKDVPYFETPNKSGGTTVFIGKEIVNGI